MIFVIFLTPAPFWAKNHTKKPLFFYFLTPALHVVHVTNMRYVPTYCRWYLTIYQINCGKCIVAQMSRGVPGPSHHLGSPCFFFAALHQGLVFLWLHCTEVWWPSCIAPKFGDQAGSEGAKVCQMKLSWQCCIHHSEMVLRGQHCLNINCMIGTHHLQCIGFNNVMHLSKAFSLLALKAAAEVIEEDEAKWSKMLDISTIQYSIERSQHSAVQSSSLSSSSSSWWWRIEAAGSSIIIGPDNATPALLVPTF